MGRLKVGDIVKVRRWGEERLGIIIQIAEPCRVVKEHRYLVDFATHSKEHLSLLDRFYWYDFSKVLKVITKIER